LQVTIPAPEGPAPINPWIAAGDTGENDGETIEWLELVAGGLAFDLMGLGEGASAPRAAASHDYGFPSGFVRASLIGDETEALLLCPGPHLNGGRRMLPVLRILALIAARITPSLRPVAVEWTASRTIMPPEYLVRAVDRWLEGGAFPALGLTALSAEQDGGLRSEGLAMFCGQELRLEPELMQDQAMAARAAFRLIHEMAQGGPLKQPVTRTSEELGAITLAPSSNGKFVRASHAKTNGRGG
jgi:hypothetical protein